MDSAEQTRTITLPKSLDSDQPSAFVVCDPSLVIIGANGAGKTRVGVWLETAGPDRQRVHRIAAQRTLRFPASTSPIGLQAAQDKFRWNDRPTHWNEDTWIANRATHKLQTRYGSMELGAVAIAPISDFDHLMTFLFSENYTRLLEHDAKARETGTYIPQPNTLITRVVRLWESVLPHRTLKVLSGEVRAQAPDGSDDGYLATALSDGERAVLYLIGQCLSASTDALIVIDEPELHLHRSIQQRLWDAIEAERHDCQFVYITHDLAFAESRGGARKVWLKRSTGETFDWREVQTSEAIPEAVYLEILGSRKPALFIEGTTDSIDYDVARAIYSDFLVKPMGGCSTVIAATKAFREGASLHRISCHGLIDRDYLTDDQLSAYRKLGVYTPLVAEAENLFLTGPMLAALASRFGIQSDAIDRVKAIVIEEFGRLKGQHALALTKRDISLHLGSFNGGDNVEDVAQMLGTHFATIDVQAIFDAHLAEAGRLIEERSYEEIIRVFNHKGLMSRASQLFGFTNPSYLVRARRLLANPNSGLADALRQYMPVIPPPGDD